MIVLENSKEYVKSPENVKKLITNILHSENEVDRDKEHFWVIGLKSSGTIRYIELVTLGILNVSLVHPREIFRMAILKAVNSIIICHNHPSGQLKPSAEDLKITKQIFEAGKLLDIAVYDHVIISEEGHCSLKEEGYMN